MTQLEELTRQLTHVCHVCATKYQIRHPRFIKYPQPPCCPICYAPMRTSQVPIGNRISYLLLLTLGGTPISSYEDSWYQKLTELRFLQYARTYADIDAIIAEVRAACSQLPQNGATPSSDDLVEAAEHAAEDRLREQLDSSLLDWRLNDLRERTIALLRAEHEHHQYVYAARRGQ